MYHLSVRDHVMIAHSFNSPTFGPARALHGATYVVDVTFYREALDDDDLVVDIGAAAAALGDVLAEFNLSNLDDHEALAGHNTTTEFMAGVIFTRMRRAIADGRLGAGAAGLCRMGVRLSESHIAWAGYEADL
ncbi:6-pyruvoyl trahydropterin synthase family protein [Salinisphaera sp.]|uniref:6-pyruvoyl trahydropterin synthase family protein n=1 Tax=Salinisphaera sp. TaxID=1914330 RepID=UPI002D791126|nr:6-carboxytetrahydropterin synthase [Salinisphaera sp.]HET7315507.1 6-carboxytetrahydropterin synthase [Salinisphaera sp.]